MCIYSPTPPGGEPPLWAGRGLRGAEVPARRPQQHPGTSRACASEAARSSAMRQVKDLIRLLFDTSLRASGFNLDEPAQFSGASTAGSSWASSSTRAMRAGATTMACLHWRRWWTPLTRLPRSPSSCASTLHHSQVWRGAGLPEGVLGPHEGGSERHLLLYRREHHAGVLIPFPGDPP